MKNNLLALALAAALGSGFSAQADTPVLSQADQDWLKLIELASPMPASALPHPRAGIYDISPVTAQADRFETASRAAKAFYSAYPSDPMASDARKLEVLLALQAVQLGASGYRQQALALSETYLANTSYSAADRLAVAQAIAALSPALQGLPMVENAAAYLSLADTIHQRFGDIPEVYGFYAGLLQVIDPVSAGSLAKQLLTMNAPAALKAQAQRVLFRNGLVGHPVDLALKMADGSWLDLAAPADSPTLLYVWSNASGAEDLAALARFKASIPAGVRIIYLSLQSDLAAADAAMAQAPAAGIFSFEIPGFDGLSAQSLGILHTPCVYVFSKSGVLTGFGCLSEISPLLAAANN